MTNNKNLSHQTGTQDHTAFASSVKNSLEIAKDKTANIRKIDSRLFVANVISPASATLLATLAATVGGNQVFPQAATRVEDGGWQLACILVAVFGFIATVSSMFKKQFADKLVLGNQCVGRLLNLNMSITTGSRNWEELTKEYSEIVKSFPEFIS